MSSTGTVLAKPPGQCCLKAVQHEGNASGEKVVISDMDSYISNPAKEAEKQHKRILLFFPDVNGPFFINNKLVMDYFASHGWLVVAPDYFRGDAAYLHRGKEGFDMKGWVTEHRKFAIEAVPKWVKEVSEKYGTTNAKYATAGYCFGAPFVLDECGADLVSAGATAHPAYLTDAHMVNAKHPIMFSCAESDFTFETDSRHSTEKILAEHKKRYYFQVFSGVEHGFALKGDPNDENQRWAKEEAASGMLRWFERFCN